MAVDTGTNPEKEGRKLGLALSGGGFRASFFHIGVLAQMACQGLLRRVEVISTVSGGSIIGALYYLHVKKLLEQTPDDRITDRDYIDIVKGIEQDFLIAVQRNLRMMTYCDWRKNWRMSSPDYSRSDRIGELYDEYFYRPVLAPGSEQMIQMKDLKIFPAKAGEAGQSSAGPFNPQRDNAGRQAKVPILRINATALNNGHVWRFEASTMGEPAYDDNISVDVDKNLRLRRPPSYDSVTERQQSVELGLAVAASACVPGVFNPLALSDLYPDIRVQLVDGGVYDNQGIQGLTDVEGGCGLMIVSDGSGQMEDEDHPAGWLAAVLSRSQGIMMKRVRGEQLSHILKASNGSVAFFHLREGLAPRVAQWYGPGGKLEAGTGPPLPSGQDYFGVPREVQDLLSKIRTDLDSFTEVEAYSLMLDGYMASEYSLSRTREFQGILQPVEECNPDEWEFMKIKQWFEKPTAQYLRHLRTAKSLAFKVFKLSTPLAAGAIALLVVFLWWLLFGSPLKDAEFHINVRNALVALLIAGTGFLLPQLSRTFEVLEFLKRPTQRLASYLGEGLLPVLGSLLVNFHLKFIDPVFIRLGKWERLDPPK